MSTWAKVTEINATEESIEVHTWAGGHSGGCFTVTKADHIKYQLVGKLQVGDHLKFEKGQIVDICPVIK